MIEEVKKILEIVWDNAIGRMRLPPKTAVDKFDLEEYAIKICQRFPKTRDNPTGYEPKPELESDPEFIGEQLLKEATKPDESKVLTIDEIKANPSYNEYLKTMSYGGAQRACQRDLTASIKDREYQERIKKMAEHIAKRTGQLTQARIECQQKIKQARQEMVEEMEGKNLSGVATNLSVQEYDGIVMCLSNKQWQELKRGVK